MNFTSVILCLLVGTCLSAVVVNPIEGVADNALAFSGTIPISNTSSSTLFYTYYGFIGEKEQTNLKNHPLLIFVGNLGFSAQYMNLGGVGPMKLNNDMTLSANSAASNLYANLMFLDLPGSGFSFVNDSELADNAPDAGAQLTYALNAFISETELAKSKSISIVGEGTFLRTLSGLDDVPNLKGAVHLSFWPELYALGKFAGVTGVDLKIFGTSEKLAIESTFSSCYTYIRNEKYLEARNCYDTILNFVEEKTKNTNLYNTKQGQVLTEFLPLIQYYFSQASTVSKFKAPTTALFESQAAASFSKTYVDQAKNYTKELSAFTKDYYGVAHLFINSENDYICNKRGQRLWLEDELSFVDSDKFRKLPLQDLFIGDDKVGYFKSVNQISYLELFETGHYVAHDKGMVINALLEKWVEYVQSDNNGFLNPQQNLVVESE